MSSGPGSQASLREANVARVIEVVRQYGQITQVELTAATGLSQASISNIVKTLVAEGVFQTENTIRSGRRARQVSLRRQSGLVAGLSIGRRTLSVAISDLDLDVRAQKRLPLPVNHRPDTTLDRAVLLGIELVESIGASPDELLAVGAVLPAPVNPGSGRIELRGMMPGWEDIDVTNVLEKRLNRPVTLDNDANAGAIAESRLGGLRGVENGIFVRASYSTGAGIVLDGKVHRGPRGTVGEIGHVQVDPAGLICVCGARGCLNTVVGADVIVDSLRLTRGYSSLADVIREALAGDPGCRQAISDAGSQIGNVLADVATVFSPSNIVVGGELATTSEVLLDPIVDALAARPLLGGSVQVHLATLGAEAELYGALILALESVETAAVDNATSKNEDRGLRGVKVS